MINATIYLCQKGDFDFDKLYYLIHTFKTEMNFTLKDLKGEGSEISYTFTNDLETEKIIIVFDSRYKNLCLGLTVRGSLESFNDCYSKLEDLIKINFK